MLNMCSSSSYMSILLKGLTIGGSSMGDTITVAWKLSTDSVPSEQPIL